MKKWYAIQTYSGFETKVRDALQQRFGRPTAIDLDFSAVEKIEVKAAA